MEEDNEGMGYLSTLPQRVVTIYIPMVVFLIILLFPFYWMGVTSFKSDNELLDMKNFNPWTIDSPTLENFRKLLFETDYSGWMINTVSIAVFATIISMVASIMAAYAIARIRFYKPSFDIIYKDLLDSVKYDDIFDSKRPYDGLKKINGNINNLLIIYLPF